MTPEAKELVERLRQEVEYDNDYPNGPREITYGRVFGKAADLITQQDARIAELEAAIDPFMRGKVPDDVCDDATLTLRWPNYETRGVTVLGGVFWYAHELRALRRARSVLGGKNGP